MYGLDKCDLTFHIFHSMSTGYLSFLLFRLQMCTLASGPWPVGLCTRCERGRYRCRRRYALWGRWRTVRFGVSRRAWWVSYLIRMRWDAVEAGLLILRWFLAVLFRGEGGRGGWGGVGCRVLIERAGFFGISGICVPSLLFGRLGRSAFWSAKRLRLQVRKCPR